MRVVACAFARCGLRKPQNQMIYKPHEGKFFCEANCFHGYLQEKISQTDQQDAFPQGFPSSLPVPRRI